MELRHLRYFVAVAEELHFARAAARLGIEQSPLSRQIRELEEELGVRLFDRTTRRTRLAWGGEALLEDARRILNSVEQIGHMFRDAAAGRRGRVRCGVVEDASTSAFSAFLTACREQAPLIQLQVLDLPGTQQLAALRAGTLDIGLMLHPEAGDDLTSIELWSDAACVMLPALHPLAKKRSIALKELADEQFVMGHGLLGPGATEASMARLRAEGIEPHVSAYAYRRAAMASLVAAGYGVAIAPRSSASLRDGIAVVPVRSPDALFTVYATIRKNEDTEATLAILKIAQRHELPIPARD